MANVELLKKFLSENDYESNFWKESYKAKNWGSEKSSKLLNWIVSNCIEEDEYYLEVGVYKGGSLCAALESNDVKAIGIDPFIMSDKERVINEFNQNIRSSGIVDRLSFYRKSFEHVNLKEKIGVYFCDGNHDCGWTYESIIKFMPNFSDKFILIVDDYDIYGGSRQIPYKGYVFDDEYNSRPVKKDTDLFLKNHSDFKLISVVPWFNKQAIIVRE